MKYYAGLILLLVMISAFELKAQGGKITGVIKDADNGETLIGANVIIKGSLMGAATDFEGRYIILNVAPGTYVIEAKYIGYSATTVQEVIVRSGLTTELNFSLSPESFAGEEVVVTAQQPVVLKDVTSSESRVSSAEIAKLPVQELADVVKLQAGVNVASDGGIHIRGGRSSEVSYIVDGIRVTDDFNRSQGLRVENQSIEELQVVSGTFNAEYGQAMSGIINISTKSGGNQFKANINVMSGGYYVYNQDLWRDIPNRVSEVNPLMQRQIAGSVEGPILKDKLTFFSSFRAFKDDGYFRGRNAFSPQGAFVDTLAAGSTFADLSSYRDPWYRTFDPNAPWSFVDSISVPGRYILYDTGERDSSIVNMGTAETYNGLLNLQFTPNKKIRVNLISSLGVEKYFGYNHVMRLTPYGTRPFDRLNYLLNLKTTYTHSPTTFATFSIANTYQEESQKLYDDPYSPLYNRLGIPPRQFENQYARAGTELDRFNRNTNSLRAKYELSSQVNRQNFVKAGVEAQFDEIFFNNITLQQVNNSSDLVGAPVDPALLPYIKVTVPQLETQANQRFSRSPRLFSAFVQDKIEFDKFIINLGLRFDRFNPNTDIPVDPKDPNIVRPLGPEYTNLTDEELRETRADREKIWWKAASIKQQVSPRFGIAYSLNDGGVVYFSYGYFFQVPTYQQLYQNSQILLPQSSGLFGGFGNPDLRPESTKQYELGFKKEVFAGTALEATIFFRDSRDYVANLGIQETYNPTIFYQQNVNLDFQKTRGATIAVNQRLADKFSFAVDYTYTKVEGSTTNGTALSANAIGPGTITGQLQQSVYNFLILQGWDKPHILNTRMLFNERTWGLNLTSQWQSGQPYTPSVPIAVRTGLAASEQPITNMARMPNQFVVNLNAYKNISIGKNRLSLGLNVFNLFDYKIVTGVFADSGQPDRPFVTPVPPIDDTFINNPQRYGQPRRFQFTANITF
jgi:outer membrane receptor protein involved in Fe transport